MRVESSEDGVTWEDCGELENAYVFAWCREYLEVPVRVEYEIAPRCRSLIPILDDLGRWCDSFPAVSGGATNGGPGPADNGGAAL